MSKPTGRTLEFDLSLAARNKEKISINSSYFKLTTVPGTVDIYLEPNDPTPITCSGPKVFCTSDGEVFGDIFLSHEIGTGVLEIFISPTVRIEDFSSAVIGFRQEIVLLHITARDFAGAVPVTQPAYLDATDPLTSGVSGDGVSRTIYDPGMELQGLEVGVPVGAQANSYGLAFNPDYAVPAANILNTPLVTNNHGRDFYYSASDAIQFYRAWASGTDDIYGTFGIGSISLQAGAVLSGYLVGFLADQHSEYWYATIYERFGPGFAEQEELVGYRADEVQEVEVRMGAEGGAPYVRWFINGTQVHEFNCPIAVDIVTGAGEWTLNYMAARENATNQDAAVLKGLLSGGAMLKVVYPNG